MRACYPFVRVHTDTVARADSRLSYGFVAGPGTYETTLTRPDLFGELLPRAVPAAAARTTASRSRSAPARSRSRSTSRSPSTTTSKARSTPERRLLLRDLFDLPDLGAMDDGIANGTYEPRAGRGASAGAVHRAARGLLAAPPAPLHRHAPEHFQNFVLFTNYQFYIDEFVRLGHESDGERRRATATTSPSSSPAT